MSTCIKPALFSSAEQCCGCGACMAACPVDAISMQVDGEGFGYPRVDEDACIGCRRCERACGFQHGSFGEGAMTCYAATRKGDTSHSASGGMFAAAAECVLEAGGAVCGCAYVREFGNLAPVHVLIDRKEQLLPLLGSKYVQSDAGRSFPLVQERLKAGQTVLFCGTPCQVAGLYGYLGNRPGNLYTVDLVCHGVPSQKMFQGYVRDLERESGRRIVDMRFRSKRDGWGPKVLEAVFDEGTSSYVLDETSAYYAMFMERAVLRPSCYACPFASRVRPADISIGDFWGVDESAPEILCEHGGLLEKAPGISCVAVNTAQGEELFGMFRSDTLSAEVEFDAIAAHNDQLRHASVMHPRRARIMRAFRASGYQGVSRLWQRLCAPQRAIHAFVLTIPVPVRKGIKRILGLAR